MVLLHILPFTSIPDLPCGSVTNGLTCSRWRRILVFFLWLENCGFYCWKKLGFFESNMWQTLACVLLLCFFLLFIPSYKNIFPESCKITTLLILFYFPSPYFHGIFPPCVVYKRVVASNWFSKIMYYFSLSHFFTCLKSNKEGLRDHWIFQSSLHRSCIFVMQ